MFRALTALIVVAASLAALSATVEAKGPPSQITITGGDLASSVVIGKADLASVADSGYFLVDNFNSAGEGVPFGGSASLTDTGETSYKVQVYTDEDGTGPQPFLSFDYFPANASHPSLLNLDGSLWKAQPALVTVLDQHIQPALSDDNRVASSLWYIAAAAVVAAILAGRVFGGLHLRRPKAPGGLAPSA